MISVRSGKTERKEKNMDYMSYNYDFDGDGTLDSYAEEIDADGDGVADGIQIYADTDGDGVIDNIYTELDTNGDGIIDTSESVYDDGENSYLFVGVDTDGDGVIDTTETFIDEGNNGQFDVHYEEQATDTDGDGIFDTYTLGSDNDLDGIFEATEVYDYDEDTGVYEIENIDTDGYSTDTYYAEMSGKFDNFDADNSDPSEVIGDPEEAMKGWEFQGNTKRCALYSQMFVIEDLTDTDIDMEEMADIAEENGWFTEDGGTLLIDMNKMLDYYGVENEMSFNNDISDIEDCLSGGGKAIVSIDANEIWVGDNDNMFTPGYTPNHAVEVIGIDYSSPDNPMVILNDSGHPDGCGSMIPLDVFVDSWEDSGCHLIACY